MSQYVIYEDGGRVRGFINVVGMPPLIDGLSVHIMVEPVDGYPEAPTPTCNLHWTGALTWIDEADLAAQRANKNAQINAAWIREDSVEFHYAGERIGAEPDDALRLNAINGFISLMGVMPPDWPGVWKTKANTFIPLPDVDAWKPFYTAFVTKGVANYMAAQSLKAQIAAATTAAEIAAIAWPA